MKKVHLLTLFLNTVAICLLVVVAIYGDNERIDNHTFTIFEGNIQLHRLLIIPILILIYNSINVIKSTLDNE